MYRLLGKLEIYGNKASIDRCKSIAFFSTWATTQIGLKRKIPDNDSWCYESQWYRFNPDALDDDLRDFVDAHMSIGRALAVQDPGITFAFLTLCPVEQDDEECFACLLSCATLKSLLNIGVALHVSPESVMPEAEYWKSL